MNLLFKTYGAQVDPMLEFVKKSLPMSEMEFRHPKTGEPLGYVGVRLGFDGHVGNLFSDGGKFWVVCANRLLALGNVPDSSPADDESANDEQDSGSN
jgi:hypothetical protein